MKADRFAVEPPNANHEEIASLYDAVIYEDDCGCYRVVLAFFEHDAKDVRADLQGIDDHLNDLQLKKGVKAFGKLGVR